MGKRKERRLAALSNAGRRVKLDLFAEPSGDLGGSSVHDEVGGEIDPTKRAGLPNSPSSSGGHSQNPLLLLGQYSDDELDEESNSRPNNASPNDSSTDQDNQEVVLQEGKGTDANTIEGFSAQMVEQQGMERDAIPADSLQGQEVGDGKENTDTRESDAMASTVMHKEMDLEVQVSSETSDAQVIGDVSLGWKIVLHEESNQYYYWNTETGETSWEVPDVLAQTTEGKSGQKTPVSEDIETAPAGTNKFGSTLGVAFDSSLAAQSIDGSIDTNIIPQGKQVYGNGPNMDEHIEGYENQSLQESDVHHSSGDTFVADGSLVNHESMQGVVANDEQRKEHDLSTSLMKQCERLLEKLKSLKGYGSHMHGHDQITKYILEVEIRLSDIKSLSSYGSSLLPFWAHLERQLKQLEDVINNEIYQLAVSAQMDDGVTATTDFYSKENEKSHGNVESGAYTYQNFGKSDLSTISTNAGNNSYNEDVCKNIVHASEVSLEGEAAEGEEVNGTAHLKPEFQHADDVDMDVDMEVEEGEFVSTTTLGDASSSKTVASAEQFIQQDPSAEYSSLASGDTLAVPPPEEEWIPPPPPDNDHVPPPPPDDEHVPPPPPPPDDPPESSYPPVPSYTETGHPHPFSGQYHLAYADPNIQYYGHTITVSGNHFYVHADGSQVAVPHASVYYEAVPNTYSETAQVVVGPVESVAYYNLQNGSVPHAPVVSNVESSQLHTESGPVNYNTLASGQNKTINDIAEVRSNMKAAVSAIGSEIDTASTVGPNLTIIQAAATTNAKDNVSAETMNVVAADPAPLAATKVQSKVSRSKKRTVAVAPSLRSNKKVSSLVDKWKAAKEELNEAEEDEPDNSYEILEKKRQREIEEWYAKQVASGEAKDNANFQPLGGDWRERVKRRRAQATKEAVETPAAEAATDKNQEPDLAELSSGLPPGWQAYWDETSRQVYYGNTKTLETTWAKPTK